MMNIKYTIMAGCLLVMGLASCEMKNEILGKEDGSSEMGLLNLGVAVDAKNNDVQTKADANPGTPESIPSVSATGYIVEISNSTGVYKTLTYDPTNASVELPVDSYTMYAHKPGGPTETDPYYGGSTSFAVKKGEATDVTVTCKMENTKIQLVYSTEMQTSFTSWSITVKAGTRSKVLTYSGTEAFAQPSAFYWMLDEGVKEITVSFVGKNKDNKDIRESRVITKPASAESSDWQGGDALAITMKPGTYDPENPNGLQGIEISAEVTWNGVEDPVDVPVVDDGGDEPGTPVDPSDPSAIKVSIPQTTYTLPDDVDKKAEAIATITSEKGLKSMKVVIEAGNAGFGAVINDEDLINNGCDFSKGVEFVGATDSSPVMTLIKMIAPNLQAPPAGATSYEFPLGEFFQAVSIYQKTTSANGHVFKIRLEDSDGNVNDETVLSIIVK
jgi:hypothetical protein